MNHITEKEFNALLNLEDRWLDVCQEECLSINSKTGVINKKVEVGYVAYVIKKKMGHNRGVVASGLFRKTKRGAINNLFKKYYAHN